MKNEQIHNIIQLTLLLLLFILTLFLMVKTCNRLEEQPQPNIVVDTVYVTDSVEVVQWKESRTELQFP